MYHTADLAEHFCMAAVNSLPAEERHLVINYYLHRPRLYLDKYAVQYGQTPRHVREVRDRALKMMRDQLRSRGIRSVEDL